MRYVLLFSAVMALLTMPARCRGAEYTVENRVPAFTVVNTVPAVKVFTTCENCGVTGKCLCWASECRCAACGLGGATTEAKKSFPSTGTTLVRPVATPAGPEREPGSFAGTPQPATSTSAPDAAPGGSTNPFTISGGCSSGNCQTPATSYRRGFIFRR